MKIIIKTNSLLHEDYGQDYLTYNKTFSIIVAKVIVNTISIMPRYPISLITNTIS